MDWELRERIGGSGNREEGMEMYCEQGKTGLMMD